MTTMKRLGTMTRTLILGGTLAALGCSAAPGTGTGDHGNAGTSGSTPGASGGMPGLFGHADGGTTPTGASTPQDFCTGLDAWLTKCGATPAAGSEASCEQSYQKYSAGQIGASTSCLAKQTTCDKATLSQCLAQAVGAPGTPGTPGPSPTADAGAPGTGQTCDQCVGAQCAAQVKGCEANPECVALYQCMQTAKTQQDAQACEQQSPNGVTDLQTVLQCVTGPCGAVCK